MSKAEMMFDAIVGGDSEAVEEMVKREPDLANAIGPDGLTPLHVAAREGQVDIALWLLAQGASLKAVDARHGATPLGWAAYFGQADAAEALLGAGADPGHQNAYGLTPYRVAEEGMNGKWTDSTAMPEDYQRVMDVLLKG